MPPQRPVAGAVGLGIGFIMAALGVFVGLRATLFQAPPLTGTLAMDLAFAVFFIARGGLQYRRWRLAKERSPMT